MVGATFMILNRSEPRIYLQPEPLHFTMDQAKSSPRSGSGPCSGKRLCCPRRAPSLTLRTCFGFRRRNADGAWEAPDDPERLVVSLVVLSDPRGTKGAHPRFISRCFS